jgi:hypothetical protein
VWIILILLVWYGLGLIGSEIGRRRLEAVFPAGDKLTDPFYLLVAVIGPVNIIVTTLVLRALTPNDDKNG